MRLMSMAAILSTSLASTCLLADTVATPKTMEPTTMQTQTDKNKSSGEDFLAANKKKPGVITLPDGLQYKVIKEGSGSLPTLNDLVTVNYAGRLIDGTEFDSSYQRGQPATFPVGGVIPGWVEALQLMKVGSVWELYIPAALAYGDTGAPPSIGPNQTLIFKVELLDIKKPYG